MTLSENYIALMKAHKLSQKDVARISGVPQATISQWVTGKANPTEDTLQRLAKAIDAVLRFVPKE